MCEAAQEQKLCARTSCCPAPLNIRSDNYLPVDTARYVKNLDSSIYYLYSLFWARPRRLNFMYRRFGTPSASY